MSGFDFLDRFIMNSLFIKKNTCRFLCLFFSVFALKTVHAACPSDQACRPEKEEVKQERQVFIKDLSGRTLCFEATSRSTVSELKQKISDRTGIPLESQILYQGRKNLQNASPLALYDPFFSLSVQLIGGGGGCCAISALELEELIGDCKELELRADPKICIANYHVSCASYRPGSRSATAVVHEHENFGGVVLYSYNGKTDWRLGGRHCKAGYIIVKRIEDLKKISSRKGQIHGKIYKSVFGIDPDSKVLGSGFAYKEGVWKFNSLTFNAGSLGDYFHDGTKNMRGCESLLVREAVEQWFDTGKQNFKLDDPFHLCQIQDISQKLPIGSNPLWSISWHPKKPLLIIGGEDGQLKAWDSAVDKLFPMGVDHENWILATAIANDGGCMLSGVRTTPDTIRRTRGRGKHICLSTPSESYSSASVDPSFSQSWLLGHEATIWSLYFSPCSRYFGSGGADTLMHLWDISRQTIIRPFSGHWSKVASLEFQPTSSKVLASGSFRELFLWDIHSPDQKPVAKLINFDHSSIRVSCSSGGDYTWTVKTLSFSPCGRYLASGNLGFPNNWTPPPIKIWDMRKYDKPCKSYDAEGVRDIHFSPRGDVLAAGFNDGVVRLWDISQTEEDPIAELTGHTDFVRSVDFTPDGEMLASAGRDSLVNIWDTGDVARPKHLKTLRASLTSFSDEDIIEYSDEKKEEEHRDDISISVRGYDVTTTSSSGWCSIT